MLAEAHIPAGELGALDLLRRFFRDKTSAFRKSISLTISVLCELTMV